MPTEYPVEVDKQSDQPSPPPSDRVDERIAQVENALVRMSANGQPQWGSTSTLAVRMGYYQVPGTSIAVIDEYKIDWAKGYGVRIAGEGEAVTTHTLFHAGSVAKSLSDGRWIDSKWQ